MKDWGVCDRCQKPTTCEKYWVEVGPDNKEVGLCEPCFFDLKELTGKWFRQAIETRESADR